MNVLLIGYRGTGKTSVGRIVAERLGISFVDADVELESRAGKTIREIFATGGENAFRDLEAEVIADLCARDEHALALGGGAVLRESNRAVIASPNNRVVWLSAKVDSICARIKSDATTVQRRPSLTNLGEREEIESLLEAREPLYRECATLVVDTEGKTTEQVAAEVQQRLAIRDSV